MTKPETESDAAAKIRRCLAHIEMVKKAGQPAAGRAPFVLSLFWSMADNEEWPCLWQSAAKSLIALGWLPQPGDFDQWYLEYRSIVRSFPFDAFTVESLLWWMDEEKAFTGLDPALIDRCQQSAEIAEGYRDTNEYPNDEVAAIAERNARAMTGELKLVGSQLEERVGQALG